MAEVGHVLAGRYRIDQLLGRGGMATIYRGHDSQLGRDVAIKVLRSEYGRDPAFVARFRQEAQSAAALSHPNVVSVFDFGMEAGDPFIVMELIDGGDLAQTIANGPLEPGAAARIGQQIYEALEAAHGRGIVHRDIKPTNVLMTRAGRVKVADFGIARAFSEAQLTMPGTTLGSVHYFSPEQARGEMVTTASDVYSAGLVFFEMLTGRRAWGGDSAGAVAVARLTGDPPLPSSLQPIVPHVLDVAVTRALARDPSNRPGAADMAALLERFVADPVGAAAWVSSTPGFLDHGPRSDRAGAGVALAAAPTLAAGAPGALAPSAARPPESSAASGYYSSPPGFDPTSDRYAGPAYGTVRGGPSPRRVPGQHLEEVPEQESVGAWGWIAAVLAVLVLFAAGVLVFLLFSGRSGATPISSTQAALITVPSFVGMALEDAQRDADELGLVMTVGSFEVAEDIDVDTVIGQDPPAGGRVAKGSRVVVTVASPSLTVLVPEVRLMTEPQMFAVLADAELLPGLRTQEFDITVPANLLIRTNPRVGVEVARGTAIDYVVSFGPPPTATPIITPTPVITPPPPVITPPPPPPPPPPTPVITPPPPVITPPPPPPPTQVVTPPPPPPTPAPTPVIVGNYATCETLGEAREQITAAGLQVGDIFTGSPVPSGQTYSDEWLVEQQHPAPGEAVPPGTFVDLLVKSPTDDPPCTPGGAA